MTRPSAVDATGEDTVHVALVAPRFPPQIGGMEAYAGRVAGWLAEEPGFRVTVLSTHPGRRGVLRGEHEGVPVVRLPSLLTLSNTPVHPAWPLQVRDLLRSWRPDVINTHAPVPGLADATTLVRGRTPVVATYHAGSLVKGGSPVDPVLRAYERWVLPRVLDAATARVAVSPVATTASWPDAQLLPPGVDTGTFVPEGPVEAGLDPDRDLLFVGRLERTSRWKGVRTLLDALAAVAETVPAVRLHLVGDGDDLPALRVHAAAAGMADRVIWHGPVDHARLPGFYRGVRAAVLPSLTESESFGMTLVEAMACGTAVVGSRVGGIPFVVRDGVDGLLALPGDSADLAARLVRLLTEDDLARACGVRGREAAVQRWAWEHRRTATLDLLAEASARRETTRRALRSPTVEG